MKHALYLSLLCLQEDIMLNVAGFGSPLYLTLHLFLKKFFPIFLIVCGAAALKWPGLWRGTDWHDFTVHVCVCVSFIQKQTFTLLNLTFMALFFFSLNTVEKSVK